MATGDLQKSFLGAIAMVAICWLIWNTDSTFEENRKVVVIPHERGGLKETTNQRRGTSSEVAHFDISSSVPEATTQHSSNEHDFGLHSTLEHEYDYLKKAAALLMKEGAGTVYVFFEFQWITGGPLAMHQLHSALNEMGFSSIFTVGIPEFKTEFSHYEPSVDWHSLKKGDSIIICDGFQWGRGDMYDVIARNGGKRLVYWLGIYDHHYPFDPAKPQPTPGFLSISAGHAFTRIRWKAPLGAVFYPPMSTKLTEVALSRDSFLDEKTNLILYDDDNGNDIAVLQVPGYEVKMMTGMSPDEVIANLRKAKFFVDMVLHGPDRAPIEASLLGCYLVVNDAPYDGKGAYSRDFPLDRMVSSKEEAVAMITDIGALPPAQYEKAYHTQMDKMRNQYLEWYRTKKYQRGIASYYTNDVSIFVSVREDEMHHVMPFVLSTLCAYPWADVYLYVPSVEEFKKRFEPELEILNKGGWGTNLFIKNNKHSKDWLAEIESLPLRPFTYFTTVSSFHDDLDMFKKMIVHMADHADVRILSGEEPPCSEAFSQDFFLRSSDLVSHRSMISDDDNLSWKAVMCELGKSVCGKGGERGSCLHVFDTSYSGDERDDYVRDFCTHPLVVEVDAHIPACTAPFVAAR